MSYSKELTNIISKSFEEMPKGQKLMMMTGQGGAKDFVKAWLSQFGLEYNWKNFRKCYTLLRKEEIIKRYCWVENGSRYRSYEITT